MAVVNPLLGLEVIGWNVFLAGIVGMLLNLDRIEVAGGRRSPFGHSVGFCLIWTYAAGIASYVYCLVYGTPFVFAGAVTLAVGIGLFSHLLLDALSGRHIFTIPNNTRPGSWLSKTSAGSDCFWGAWDRAKVERFQVRDSQVNIFSLVAFLMVIAVF